jgi:hypothetical protein
MLLAARLCGRRLFGKPIWMTAFAVGSAPLLAPTLFVERLSRFWQSPLLCVRFVGAGACHPHYNAPLPRTALAIRRHFQIS